MVRLTFIAILSFGFAVAASAQTDIKEPTQEWARNHYTDGQNKEGMQKEGEMTFYMDKRIMRLDSLKKLNPTGMEGYRVQIFFGDRNEAQARRVEFLRDYPEVGAYVSYLAPNFRLRVGDFRTRLDSEKFKSELSSKYQGTYIVKDQIEFPPLSGKMVD